MTQHLNRRGLLRWSCLAGLPWIASGIGQTSKKVMAAPKGNSVSPMRITKLHAFQPATPGSPPDWRTQLGQIVVEVHTESGLVGIGVGGGGKAGIHLVETVLTDLLVGQDATNVEELHREMYRHTLFYGRKGLVIMALSGVDLALWDLRGKRAGLPVAKLLNPNVDMAAAIPTYTTVFAEKDTDAALAERHQAIKLHVERFGRQPDLEKLVAFVRYVRERIGTKTDMMVDAYGMWDIDTSLRVAEAIAPLDIKFLEEPLPPDDLDGYAALVKRCPLPIAGGEHEYMEQGFKELIDRKLHAVLQPDINWCGGLTTVIAVYRMAKAAGIQVCLHRGCEPFALHALAALDAKPLAESPRTWFKCLKGAPQAKEGVIRLNAGQGFGVSVE